MDSSRHFDHDQHWQKLGSRYDIDVLGPAAAKQSLKAHLKYTEFDGFNCMGVALMGEPGCGKTAIVNQACEEEGLGVVVARVSNMHEGMLDGYPVPLESKSSIELQTVTQLRDQFDSIKNDGKRIAIFFDELNRAPQRKINSIFNIVDNKVWAGYKLPEDTVFILSINPPTEAHDVIDVFADAAFNRRWKLMGVRPKVDDFLAYADTKQDFHWIIKEYVRTKPKVLEDLQSIYSKGKKYSCAAALDSIAHMLTRVEKDGIALHSLEDVGNEHIAQQIVSSIGKSHGLDLLTFISDASANITPEKVLTDYPLIRSKFVGENDGLGTAEAPMDPGQMAVFCTEMAEFVANGTIDVTNDVQAASNLSQWLGDMQEEPMRNFLEMVGNLCSEDKMQKLHESLCDFEGYKRALSNSIKPMHEAMSDIHG